MRHGRSQAKLNRTSEHRRSLLANMADSLIKHEQLITTLAKARALRPYAEKLVTRAKKGGLHRRRVLLGMLHHKASVAKLFDVLAPRYAKRAGGYVRVLKAGYRYGDNAPLAVIEMVERDRSALGQDSGPPPPQKAAAEAASEESAAAEANKKPDKK